MNILMPFGAFNGQFGIFCGHLVFIFPILVCSTKKNLATLVRNRESMATNNSIGMKIKHHFSVQNRRRLSFRVFATTVATLPTLPPSDFPLSLFTRLGGRVARFFLVQHTKSEKICQIITV
jgi:hypothetical protein